MGFWSDLINSITTPDNNSQPGYQRREPTAEDYIRSGEIEADNYDEGQRNTIDEHGELPEDEEEDW